MKRLVGFNLGGWFSQVDCIEEKDPLGFVGLTEHCRNFIDQNELDLISDSGVNHLRLPVDYFNIVDPETMNPNEEILELLDLAISRIRKRDLGLILDLHKCPGHDFHLGTKVDQDFFKNPQYRGSAKQVWSILADRYKMDSEIIFEILNEPVAPSNAMWNEVQQEMHEFLRAKAPNNPILLASNRWNHPSNFSDLEPVNDSNVIYSFHMYEPLSFTHQNAPWSANPHLYQTTSYPGEYKAKKGAKYDRMDMEWGYWDRKKMKKFLEPVLDFRDRTNLTVSCNEFGVFLKASREGQLNWLIDLLDIFREYDIGYSYWNFKNLDFGLVSKNEALHKDCPQFQNKQRADFELLNILSAG